MQDASAVTENEPEVASVGMEELSIPMEVTIPVPSCSTSTGAQDAVSRKGHLVICENPREPPVTARELSEILSQMRH